MHSTGFEDCQETSILGAIDPSLWSGHLLLQVQFLQVGLGKTPTRNPEELPPVGELLPGSMVRGQIPLWPAPFQSSSYAS